MITKEDLLSIIDVDYLREFLISTNNVPRYEIFSKTGQELYRFASSKLTKNEIYAIRRAFLSGKPSRELGKLFREKNGKELGDLFIDSIKPKIFKKELVVNNRICDVTYLDKQNNLIAVEVKANGDKIENATKQCEDYSKWANFVYLLIERKKINEFSKITLPKYVGVTIYDKNKFRILKKPDYIAHECNTYIKLLNTSELKKIASLFNLSTVGNKKQLKEKIIKRISGLKTLFNNSDRILFECKKTLLNY